MIRIHAVAASVLFAWGVFPTLAAAQRDTASGPRRVASPVVPDIPAFTYLDASPSNVARPSTVRELGMGLLNGLDSLGHVRQGLAFIASPSMVLGASISLARYRSNPLAYILANTDISLASTRASGDSASTRVALGIRSTIFNRLDVLTDGTFTDSIIQPVLDACLAQALGTGTEEAARDAIRKCIEEGESGPDAKVERWANEWVKTHWNAAYLVLAAAVGGTFARSEVNAFDIDGFSAWLAGAVRAGGYGQLAYQLRYNNQPGAGPRTQSLNVGAKGLLGGPAADGFLEFTGTVGLSRGTGGSGAWSAGFEFAPAKDTWLSTGFGSSFSSGQTATLVLIANLRWAVSTQPRFPWK